jgi:hypothetical protein
VLAQVEPAGLGVFVDAQPTDGVDTFEDDKLDDQGVDRGGDGSEGLHAELLAHVQVLDGAAQCGRGEEGY